MSCYNEWWTVWNCQKKKAFHNSRNWWRGREKIEEYVDNLIIENEAEKFFELFEKTFCEETDETEFDSEDGVVNDLINKIVLKIKEKLNSEKVTSGAGLNLLRLLLVFVEQFLRKDKSDGADKSSPEAE